MRRKVIPAISPTGHPAARLAVMIPVPAAMGASTSIAADFINLSFIPFLLLFVIMFKTDDFAVLCKI
jgi:hypothetical protein